MQSRDNPQQAGLGRRFLSDELTAAVKHHRAGRLKRAEVLYRKILKMAPRNPDALNLLGVLAVARGDADQGIKLISEALAVVPKFAQGHSNLGNAFRAAGRFSDACGSYRRAIGLRPEFAAAHSNLGVVLCEEGEFAAAIASCERAVALDPLDAEIRANLGIVLRRAVRLDPAEASLRKALELDPGSADLQVALGEVLLELRRFEEAVACYRRATELDPRRGDAHYGLANAFRSAGDVSLAIGHYRNALKLGCGGAAASNDIGRCYLALGRVEEAIAAFRDAVAADPDFADAYRNLANCRALVPDHQKTSQLAGLAARLDLPTEQRAAAGFALGKALDDADRYDEAFAAYDGANLLLRATRAAAGDVFEPVALARRIDHLMAEFTPGFFERIAGWGNPSDLPVFIVGMPRSGTSLVEQIAATHTRVKGAGELRTIGEAASELGDDSARWTEATVRRVADLQLERLMRLGNGAQRVIDKLPDNIFTLGVIAGLFPRARIIFCQRDPRDIGLSCYFQMFSAGLLAFSYDLADCGVRIRETERLAAHWHRVLPLRYLDVQYESLVENLEEESRKLIAFLGLTWEPACLEFHRKVRTVQTASSWQVRQPLYDSSIGRWRRYERHVEPLMRELNLADQ